VSVLMAGSVAVTVGAQAAAITGVVGIAVTAIDALLTYRTARIEAQLIEQTLEHIDEEQQRSLFVEQQTIEQWHRAHQPDVGGPRRPHTNIDRQLQSVGINSTGQQVIGPQYWHGVESQIGLGR
jgi:hypothetical protein